MEFYLHNKDDQKSSTLVELATTFKIDGTNYIVYYNKEVEKSMIDIYIGIISYGDQSLVINKIDPEKQGRFLSVIKDIIAAQSPETEFGDYDNIIDTATIILESVQKIQIPTNSLDLLKKYHKKENDVAVADDKTEELTFDIEEKIEQNNDNIVADVENEKDTLNDNPENTSLTEDNQENLESENNQSNDVEDNKVDSQENLNLDNTSDNKDDNQNMEDSTENNQDTYIHSNHDLNSLDSLLDERKEEVKKEKKKKKVISTPILILLIITIIGGALLYFLV